MTGEVAEMKCPNCGKSYDDGRGWMFSEGIAICPDCLSSLKLPDVVDIEHATAGYPITGMVVTGMFSQVDGEPVHLGYPALAIGPYEQDPAVVQWLKAAKERIEDVWHVARYGREYFDW